MANPLWLTTFRKFKMLGIALTLMPSYEMKLSPRQLEILRLVAQGDTVKAIALSLGISVHTVKAHLKIAKERLHARTATHAAAIAIAQGIVSLGPSIGSRKDDFHAVPRLSPAD